MGIDGRSPANTAIDSSFLAEAWRQAAAGIPRIVLFSDPLDQGLEAWLSAWLQGEAREQSQLFRFDFHRKPVGPFSPFLDLLSLRFAAIIMSPRNRTA
jgi:hypothetical protein